MTGPGWTAPDGVLLIDGHTVIPPKYLADCINRSEYMALARCVDTLARARRLARDAQAAPSMTAHADILGALLDLLTGDVT